VFTPDSKYIVDGMNSWVHGWARNGRERKTGPNGKLELWHRAIQGARRHAVPLRRDLNASVGNPLPPARAFCWVKQQHPHLEAAMAHALFKAFWAEGRDLSTPQQVGAIELPGGLDGQAGFARMLLMPVRADPALCRKSSNCVKCAEPNYRSLNSFAGCRSR